MPRVRLAHWHAGHAPGDEIDVSEDTLRDLQRDGRVAEVVEAPQVAAFPHDPAEQPQPDPVIESGEAQRAGENTSRRRR